MPSVSNRRNIQYCQMAHLTIFIVMVALASIISVQASDFLEDERAVLVKFYSGMCGSCQEFQPTWAKIEKAAKSVATAKVNIDEAEGQKLAEKLGVLEEGLPNVRLFKSTKGNGVSIVPGIPDSYKNLMKKIKVELKTLTKRDDGMLLKNSS